MTNEVKNSPKGLQVYPNVPVFLTYQNFGSGYLGILRGDQENIEQVYNGLFNLQATSGELEYFNIKKTVALFWTSKNALARFFMNQYLLPRINDDDKVDAPNTQTVELMNEARLYAVIQLNEMSKDGHEFIMDFSEAQPEEHSLGQITAERPDNDFRDAVLAHAFTDKTNNKKVEESIDTEVS